MAGRVAHGRPVRGRSLDGARWVSVLSRPVPPTFSVLARILTLAAIVVGAAMVAASAIIHLHLWLAGYRHIHLIGPLFLAQAVSGIVLALAIVGVRRLVVIAAGVVYLGGSIVALLISDTVGFLGLHDTLSVPWAGASLATELIGLVALTGASVALLRAR